MTARVLDNQRQHGVTAFRTQPPQVLVQPLELLVHPLGVGWVAALAGTSYRGGCKSRDSAMFLPSLRLYFTITRLRLVTQDFHWSPDDDDLTVNHITRLLTLLLTIKLDYFPRIMD